MNQHLRTLSICINSWPCQRFLVFEAAILSKLAELEEGSGTLIKEDLIIGEILAIIGVTPSKLCRFIEEFFKSILGKQK